MKDFTSVKELRDDDIMVVDSNGTKKITMSQLIDSLLTINGLPNKLQFIQEEMEGLIITSYNDSISYTDTQIEKLVNGAPEELDTLLELAEAIKNNDSIMDALNEAITKKADKEEVSEQFDLVSEGIQNQINSLKEKIAEIEENGVPGGNGGGFGGSSLPIGSIVAYMESEAPSGFLACDGASYPVEQYPKLAEFFGVSEGSFKVPDLQGEFLRGIGTNSHANQGNGGAVGDHQDATRVANIWIEPGTIGFYNPTDGFHWSYQSNSDYNYNIGDMYNAYRTTPYSSSPAPSSVSTRPTNTSVLWMIKCDDPEDSKLQDLDFDNIFEQEVVA